MFIFKRDKMKEKKETVVGNPSKKQKVADPASSGEYRKKFIRLTRVCK
jgi:hypothetical protein